MQPGAVRTRRLVRAHRLRPCRRRPPRCRRPALTTTAVPAPSSTTTSSTTRTTSTTTSTTTSSTTSTSTTLELLPTLWLPHSNAASDALARSNPAVTMTVVRDGGSRQRASGTTIGGELATAGFADGGRQCQQARDRHDDRTAWPRRASSRSMLRCPGAIPGIVTHPGWADVTVRELLDHAAGMPVARTSWFEGPGNCGSFLPTLIDRSPTSDRLPMGLLERQLLRPRSPGRARHRSPTRRRRTAAPVRPTRTVGCAPHDRRPAPDRHRLPTRRRPTRPTRWRRNPVVSTDDLAVMLAAVTPADLDVMRWPGIIIDQYGWGHTGW